MNLDYSVLQYFSSCLCFLRISSTLLMTCATTSPWCLTQKRKLDTCMNVMGKKYLHVAKSVAVSYKRVNERHVPFHRPPVFSLSLGSSVFYFTEHLINPFRSIAKELADWLIQNNVVEHIFGPNLHIEVRTVGWFYYNI